MLQVIAVMLLAADALDHGSGGLYRSLPLQQGVLKLQTCHCSCCMHIHAGKRAEFAAGGGCVS